MACWAFSDRTNSAFNMRPGVSLRPRASARGRVLGLLGYACAIDGRYSTSVPITFSTFVYQQTGRQPHPPQRSAGSNPRRLDNLWPVTPEIQTR